MPIVASKEVEEILQSRLRFCPGCKAHDSFSYHPAGDIKSLEGDKVLWYCFRCLCGHRTLCQARNNL